AGTTIPSASRCEITCLSPTGYFGTSNSGGGLGLGIKLCNIDTIWIKGRARHPVYLVIDEKGVTFKDARSLWGKDVFETVDTLKRKEGKDTEIISIGVAGEKGVRFASIQNGYYHAFGRTGTGAIMGSKMLKAICFNGKGEITVKDKKSFLKISKEIKERITASDSFGYTRRYGSMVVSDVYNRIGILPGYNFRKGSIDGWEQTRGRRFFEENFKIRDFACVSCPIGCLNWSRIRHGKYAGHETHGLEVTYVLEFGAKLGITDISEILICVELCNRLGMDVISVASVIAYLIELFEKNLVKETDIGLKPAFGDFESISKLISYIGKREGIGKILGDGIRHVKKYFIGSEDFACEIKGLEMPVRDPRGRFDTWILGYIINTRGGDHLRIRTPTDDLRDFERDYIYEPLFISQREIALLDIPQYIKDRIFGTPPSRIHIPSMAKYGEELLTLLNSFGLCIRPPVLRTIGPLFMARAFNAMFGYELNEEMVIKNAERIINMQHMFNVKRGLTIDEYTFPERFYRESIEYTGGIRPPLDQLKVKNTLLEYFKLRGWDNNGKVKEETAERLGLNEFY
ncbi:MAG: hypothetical protein N2596_09225, partial [Syntrophorhabdaceae bacterium]|nr:hypothetical protein [Syntrophorhabdaceae bacterium]